MDTNRNEIVERDRQSLRMDTNRKETVRGTDSKIILKIVLTKKIQIRMRKYGTLTLILYMVVSNRTNDEDVEERRS